MENNSSDLVTELPIIKQEIEHDKLESNQQNILSCNLKQEFSEEKCFTIKSEVLDIKTEVEEIENNGLDADIYEKSNNCSTLQTVSISEEEFAKLTDENYDQVGLKMVDAGYTAGQSDNLPRVDMFMAASHIRKSQGFSQAEVCIIKARKSARDCYGDSAVGWVQVRRANNVCTVKAKITPEQKKQYAVTCHIDEDSEKVLDVQCPDCPVSPGGCIHAIAFLMWLHRRSEEPSPTEVVCYWTESKVSKVKTTTIQFLTLKDFGAEEELSSDEDSSLFLQEVVRKGLESNSNSQLLKYFKLDGTTDSGVTTSTPAPAMRGGLPSGGILKGALKRKK